MKKVILMPFRAIWFALKNEMYGVLFPAAVLIAGIAGGIALGNIGSGIVTALVILTVYGIAKAAWNRVQRIGGQTKRDLQRQIRRKEKQKELITYLLK